MNWGGVAGGFAQGFANGLVMGKSINDAYRQYKIDQVRQQGMEEAQQARSGEIANMIKDNGIGVSPNQPASDAPPGTQTGQTAPDTAEVQTRAVPMPQVATTPAQGGVGAAPSQQPVIAPDPSTAAAPSAPTAPAAPTIMPPAQPPAPVAAAAPPADATGAVNPAAAGITPPPTPARKRFSVGDASFDTVDEARAHAEKTAPSVTDFFMKNAVPKISQAYLEQGDVEKAEAWDKYAKDKANQKNMDTWAKAYRAANAGDMDGAANHVFELYKSYDDGVTPMSKETVKDKDGNVTGFNVRLKNDSTGEERTQFVDRDALLNMGLSALSPPAMFEQAYKQKQAVDAARMANAAKAADEQRKLQGQIVVEGVKAGYKSKADERLAAREDQRDQRRADREDDRDMRRADREAENIRLRADLENKFKKTTDPQERRAMIVTELSKNPMYANKSQDVINAAADKWMGAMQAGQNPKPSSIRPDVPDAAPAPAPSAAPAPAPQSRGVPVLDTKTGKTVLIDPVTRKVLSN